MKKLVIFSGSNKLIEDSTLIKNLKIIAENLDSNKYQIWYGGGNAGIMGIIPKFFDNKGGLVYSINAKQFADKDKEIFGITYVKETFRERQNSLVDQGEIYLALPGGVGTISEIFDVLVNNDVNGRNCKMIFYSYNNYFEDILYFLKKNIKSGYIRPHIMDNIIVHTDYKKLIDYLNQCN